MEIFINKKVPSSISRAIDEILKGMILGLTPQLAFDGTAGTYMLRDQERRTRAIFKPIDEEAYAPNNPRGYIGEFGQTTLRSGVLSGEGVIREVASFMIDHKHFSCVPPTIFAEVIHPSFNYSSQEMGSSSFQNSSSQYKSVITSLVEPSLSGKNSETTATTASSTDQLVHDLKYEPKYGSLQYFVKADDMASNFSSDLFWVDEVHKIGILDLRIMNLDRNDGNLLVQKVSLKNDKKGRYEYKLIPIDHSLSIPDNLEVYSYDLCWMDWEQSHVNFSKDTMKYINTLDVLKDVKMLDDAFKFRRIWLRNIRITGTLLKRGAEAGLNLFQIGSILWREDDFDDEPQPSILEKIVNKAQEMAKSIRKIKNTSIKAKLDSIEDFKNRKRSRRTSLNNNSPDEMVSKLSKKRTIENGFETSSEEEKKEPTGKPKLNSIKNSFAAFEMEESTNSDPTKLKTNLVDLSMNKFSSHIINKDESQNIDLSQVGQKLNARRDRAQSENDTGFMFECERAASSPKKFVQRRERYDINLEEDENNNSDCQICHEEHKDSDSSSDSSDEDKDSEGNRKSPPIKRTVSLPRIKILENKTELPKIKEEDEEDVDLQTSNKSNEESTSKHMSTSPLPQKSINVTNMKPKKLKVTRQKSEELREIKLKDSPYDEDFFYYFELYLDESIKKILAVSQKLSVGRNRSRSEV